MIVKRTVTSHMKPAEYDVYKIKLKNDETKEYGYFTTNYRQIKLHGFRHTVKKMKILKYQINLNLMKHMILKNVLVQKNILINHCHIMNQVL